MSDFNSDDNDLIERITSGDKQAFKEFIERYRRLISHIVFRMVDNTADREDVCQEIFIKAYKNLKNFKFQSQLSTWIGKIAFNSCVNYLRKLKIPMFDDISIEEETFDTVQWENEEHESPEHEIEKRDIANRIKSAVSRLPANHRTIITLYHIDEMSYAQIGEIMELPEGTVKSYLFRARKLLKAKLMKNYQREDIFR
ncbi:hypothetical protein AMJ80_10805 [bacterium SM23_31]|nr:MAG: hypothetical protein AMJ80_10805 [bacterium SM23_31]